MAGEELEALSGLLVAVADAAQDEALVTAANLDELIRRDSCGAVHGIALQDHKAGVGLEP